MTDWDIQPRSSACSACGQSFADKAAYHTLLSFDAEGYKRRDLCHGCLPSAPRDAVISCWQGEYRIPMVAPEPIQKETAETWLRKLVGSDDPSKAGVRYILAVMLERKKILRHRDTVKTEDGTDILVYEQAITGESFTVPDPHLRLDQLEEVQRQVAELLTPQTAAETA